jgi:hypothetical protein
MSIFTRDKVWFSADRGTYWEYDPGSGNARLVVDGVPAIEATKTAVSLLLSGAASGDFLPAANGTQDIGSATKQWNNVFLNGVLTFGAGGTLNADSGTATATAGAATLSKMAGVITTESLATAAGSEYTLTLTNTVVAAADMVFVSLANGTNAAGTPEVGLVTPGAGSVAITVRNKHASAAFAGTLKISFLVVKA